MAIVTITADLNGGDQITPNADLTYKVYNGSDSLITSKGSANTDADVSVSGDVVTLINVDIGAETEIKITSTNQFGQEAVLSDPFTYVPPVNPFDNASVILSLRDIFGTNNAVVRVRRDSDNSEQDFTATEITDGTLLSFVGGGNGLVSKLYDQSGNGNDGFENTSTQQLQIVTSGAINTLNVMPSFNNDGNDGLVLTTPLTQMKSIFMVLKPKAEWFFSGLQGNGGEFYRYRNIVNFIQQRSDANGSINYDFASGEMLIDQVLININAQTTGYQGAFINDVVTSKTTQSNLLTQIDFLWGRTNYVSNTGIIGQEFIAFDTDNYDKDAIQNNINNYYNIY